MSCLFPELEWHSVRAGPLFVVHIHIAMETRTLPGIGQGLLPYLGMNKGMCRGWCLYLHLPLSLAGETATLAGPFFYYINTSMDTKNKLESQRS